MAEQLIISIDLGGTKILSSLLNQGNQIIDRVKVPTDSSKGPEYLVECIADSVNKLLANNSINQSEIKAICMGVPGTVNPHTGIIGNAPNLGIKEFNIKESLQKYFEIPVLIENDVNLAALGIKRFEFDSKANNMIVVFIGTGIGSALIFNGQLYRGSSFFAGEIGHMKVSDDGKLSGDFKNSTYENIASRTAVVKSIIEDISEKGKKSSLKINKNRVKSKALAKALAEGDPVVVKNIERSCKVTGTILGSITTLLNIDTIVLGGGVIEAMSEFMLPKIVDAFKKAVLPEPGKDVKIIATKLGDDAALYGGPELAAEFLG